MLVPTLDNGCRPSRHSRGHHAAVWEAGVPISKIGSRLRIVSLVDHRVIRPMLNSDIDDWRDAYQSEKQWGVNGEPVYLDWDDVTEKVRVAPNRW